MMLTDVVTAYKFSINNRSALMGDTLCGCFYCMKLFRPLEITEWIEDPGGTALCPYCGIDSIIGESSKYPITKEFLSKMNQHWFQIK